MLASAPRSARTSAMQNLQEPFAPARAVLGKLAFALGIALAWERPSNQDDAANGWPVCYFPFTMIPPSTCRPTTASPAIR